MAWIPVSQLLIRGSVEDLAATKRPLIIQLKDKKEQQDPRVRVMMEGWMMCSLDDGMPDLRRLARLQMAIHVVDGALRVRQGLLADFRFKRWSVIGLRPSSVSFSRTKSN